MDVTVEGVDMIGTGLLGTGGGGSGVDFIYVVRLEIDFDIASLYLLDTSLSANFILFCCKACDIFRVMLYQDFVVEKVGIVCHFFVFALLPP